MLRYQPSSATKIKFKDALASRYLNQTGELNFKKLMSNYLDTDYFITHTSFMRSILSCLKYIKDQHPDKTKVLLPRYSCMTFAHAIIEAGLEIKYCDQNSDDLSIDLQSLEKEYDDEVLALICVNLLGLSNRMNSIKSFCVSKKIFLVEDLGYSIGTEYKNTKLGNFGDFSVLNFKEGKTLPISGGMVATSNKDYYMSNSSQASNHDFNFIRTVALIFLFNSYFYSLFNILMNIFKINFRRSLTSEDTLLDSNDEYKFNFSSDERNFKLSPAQFELGSRILKTFSEQRRVRKKNSIIYSKNLKNLHGIKLIEQPFNSLTHYTRYPILVHEKRDELMKILNLNGIEATSLYQTLSYKLDLFPGSKKIKKQILTLPLHPLMHDKDIKKTIRIITSFSKNMK